MTFAAALTWLNAVASIILVIGLVLIALGYRHSLRKPEPSAEWYFSLGKVLLALALGIRLLFWDVIWSGLNHMDRDKAQALSDAIGGVNSNIVSILIGLGSVYCSLKARHLLVPAHDRHRWPWWKAWAHPDLRFWWFSRRRDD